jgi:hypothetical protein
LWNTEFTFDAFSDDETDFDKVETIAEGNKISSNVVNGYRLITYIKN